MADSRLKSILDDVESMLESAIGVGSGATHTIPLAQFYQRKLPWDQDLTHPACIITPQREQLPNTGTNQSDDWLWRIGVAITNATNRNLTSEADKLYYLKQTAMETFHNKRLTTLTEIFCIVEPGDNVDVFAFARGIDAAAFVIRCQDRRTR